MAAYAMPTPAAEFHVSLIQQLTVHWSITKKMSSESCQGKGTEPEINYSVA